jgi:mannose-6-phosphate isomerase-like protein (cupin superfamily)
MVPGCRVGLRVETTRRIILREDEASASRGFSGSVVRGGDFPDTGLKDGIMIKIEKPTVVEAAGNLPKRIEEYVGRANTATEALSIARMRSPAGWEEPGQTPEFDEYTVVLAGTLRVATRDGVVDIGAGQAVIAEKGEWVQYSTPLEGGAEYIAVCHPAFSMETVQRDG